MRLNDNAKRILLGALADIDRLSRLNPWDMYGDDAGRWRAAIGNAQKGIVAYGLAGWLGRKPTRSEVSAHSRTLATMADSGLVNLHGGEKGARTTHIGLTPEGLALARKLAAEAAGDPAGPLMNQSSIATSSDAPTSSKRQEDPR